ncbi:hypothetical protein [Flavobacterium litorale]|uniref:Uncharacterized protein n=1 Tax=Flavobacterium litorale TaxID=2856519 RepID=A0ABX8V7J7_9FLAO|nr:hypothetical protein [Flavobacterium litorale]QYJ68820.1 hypothetical protein K1I41_02760 [Flavobacterium litorale]
MRQYRDGLSATDLGYPADGYTHEEGNTQSNVTEVDMTSIFGRDLNIPVDENGNIDASR